MDTGGGERMAKRVGVDLTQLQTEIDLTLQTPRVPRLLGKLGMGR